MPGPYQEGRRPGGMSDLLTIQLWNIKISSLWFVSATVALIRNTVGSKTATGDDRMSAIVRRRGLSMSLPHFPVWRSRFDLSAVRGRPPTGGPVGMLEHGAP